MSVRLVPATGEYMVEDLDCGLPWAFARAALPIVEMEGSADDSRTQSIQCWPVDFCRFPLLGPSNSEAFTG